MVKFKISNVFNLKSFIHEKILPDKKIKLALVNNFPRAMDIEWSFKNNAYEATFTEEGIYKVASFDERGKLKEEKVTVLEKQLPSRIKDILYKKYKMHFLLNALIVNHENEKHFEIIFDSEDKSRYFLLFNETGFIIREQLLFAIKKELLDKGNSGLSEN